MLGLPLDSIIGMVARYVSKKKYLRPFSCQMGINRCLRNECGLLATNQSKEEVLNLIIKQLCKAGDDHVWFSIFRKTLHSIILILSSFRFYFEEGGRA